MKKAGKKWIEFDFILQEKKPVSQDKHKISNYSFRNGSEKLNFDRFSENKKDNFNFELLLKPRTVTDLAVHPKKIEEVKIWLQNNAVQKKISQQTAAFLLLSGPTGSGKTTTVQVLCENMSISLSEWVNPVDQDFDNHYHWQNQISRFKEFLTESKWNSLFASSDKKVIVVEEFPNVLIRNPGDFDEVLEECYYRGNYPIIFICSDSFDNGTNLSDSLFTQEIKNKYKLTHICFNSCASTLMKNALKRAHNVVQDNLDLFKTPSQSTVDAIIASSMGDIRCAISQYYFASLLGTADLPTVEKSSKKQGNKRKRNEHVSSIKIMCRDENLGLFHGLGRVLNPKRTEIGNSWRLNCDVQRLVDEFSSQPGIFTSFLFENYLKYFGDLNDICKGTELLSLSQTFLNKWVDRHDTLIFALWISVMGLMIYNEHRISRWNQIVGPRKLKKRCNTTENTRHLSVTDLYYYNIITKNEISQFKSS